MVIEFMVPGRAKPQGSMKFATSKSTGKPFPIKNAKLENWRALVAVTADAAMKWTPPFDGGVVVRLRFYFKRPKKHYRTGRYSNIIRDDAPSKLEHFQTPDIDKLIRGVLDALTGVVYHDDAQVREVHARKMWAGFDRTTVFVDGTHYLLAEEREA